MKTIIFCISVNTSKVASVMLTSFHKHHPCNTIYIVGTPKDFEELGDIGKHQNNILVDISDDKPLLQKFTQGHSGTAHVFASVILGYYGKFDSLIHIDSDIVFKKPSLQLITDAFDLGYNIVGSRRCYKYNPSGVGGLDNFSDTVSTYYFGITMTHLPMYGFDYLCRVCEGAEHPLGFPVLDFFDGIIHTKMQNGGKVKFIDQEIIGSQNEFGQKTSSFPSNMHLDMGSHLAHFGGVGSGYAYFEQRSAPPMQYARWSLGRYSLFCKLFYNKDIGYINQTVYGKDGRWICGNYDAEILKQVKADMKRI
jgi:hypothetical protein